jgi:twitching motility protein PilI
MARRTRLTDFQRSLSERLAQAALREVATGNRLGVESGGEHWLLRLDQVSEILFVAEIQEVPATQRWFRGVVNVRGQLMGAVDWSEFRGGTPTPINYRTRLVLLSDRLGVPAGLLVGAVTGLRSIQGLDRAPSAAADAGWKAASYAGSDGRAWHEPDLALLAREASFLGIEAH